ncbi:MAG: hypothetical protein LBM96_10440 [Methanobrevibacter sp.]|jgi:hypothetical protein|nr:hypothetical protein [Candidatus Methanoflexus mossambicus]
MNEEIKEIIEKIKLNEDEINEITEYNRDILNFLNNNDKLYLKNDKIIAKEEYVEVLFELISVPNWTDDADIFHKVHVMLGVINQEKDNKRY